MNDDNGLEYVEGTPEENTASLTVRNREQDPQPETRANQAEEKVTYVGRRAAYHDGSLDMVFKRNEPRTVSREDAERLVALGGNREVFVRSTE